MSPSWNANTEQLETYFRLADLDGDGIISGAEGVAFLQGSNLPKHVLAQIWSHADQNQTGYLSRPEFYNALKLVTVAQSKRELTPEVVKEALYGPTSAKIPAPHINLSSSGQSQFSWPKMAHASIQKYAKVFTEVDADRDGKITGEQARNLFLSWRLPREVLKQVWDLSDQDGDGMLSLREFCIALYLMERYKEGRQLPSSLPNSVLLDETLLSLGGC